MSTVIREIENDTLTKRGWQCPRCENVVSPDKDCCPKCEKEVKESIRDDRQLIID